MFENVSVIDEIISKYSIGWKIDRISKVALSILRLAIYEIKFIDDIPSKVSVNEAVELAKVFGLEKDAAYINGLLGSFVKEN